MKRRQFMGTTAALTFALSQSRLLAALDADNKYRKQIGIQLYTLRNEIKQDVKGTIKAVADAGYKQVEPYGFPGADDMIQAAKDNGLAVNSSHMNIDSIMEPGKKDGQPLQEILDKANGFGMSHLVVPYLPGHLRGTVDKYKQVAEKCNVAAELAKKSGIQLSYHNHSFEFEPLEGGKTGYDVFVEEFSKDMKFEIDVFWVQAGGHDSSTLLRELAGRVSQLHLKDLDASVKTPIYDGISKEAFKELGNGVIDMEPILAAAEEVGVAHCHIEQDHSPHPIESVQESIAFLNKM